MHLQVVMWDIRKGRSAVHQLGAYGPATHPVLTVFRLKNALAAVPGLASETHIPDSKLTQLLLDPCDGSRAGYTLACGWQGVPCTASLCILSLLYLVPAAVPGCGDGLHSTDARQSCQTAGSMPSLEAV